MIKINVIINASVTFKQCESYIKFGYLFCNRGRVPLLSLNELKEKLQAAIIISKIDSPNKNNISKHLQWLRNSSDL